MRIGLVIGQIERIGGMEKQAVLLARELTRCGHGVILFVSAPRTFTRSTGSLDLGPIERKHLYHTRYSSRVSAWLLRRHCARNKISTVMAFNVENAEIAVSANLDARIVMNVRGTRFSRDPALARRYRSVASRCNLMITNSGNTLDLLRNSNITAPGGVVVIHNGIELPEAQPSREDKMILYVGSIKEVKDPMTFVKACREVIGLDDEVRVVMVGDGNMRPAVEEYIRSNGLEGRFSLTGELPYDRIPYAGASVFVNSSVRESSSNSLLEALSFGIPVVATANSGNSDILARLGCGRLVPISNVGEMANAIRSFLDAGFDRRLAIFESSRQLIREHYSVSRMVDGYIESLSSP